MASVVDLKSKEEKDAELDRKIEALRKKNEALIRRHQLIEEDKKRAEQEGIAITTPRKARNTEPEPDKARKEKENFSITLDVNAGEKRVINEGRSPKHSQGSPRSPDERKGGRTGLFSSGRSPPGSWTNEPHVHDGNVSPPLERPARGRRSQGMEAPRRGDHGAEMPRRGPRGNRDGSPGEKWNSSPRGVAMFGDRGGRGAGTPGRGGGTPARSAAPGLGEPSGPDRKVKEWEEKRRQNIEKMNEEMEQIAEYERHQRDGMREKNPIRNFLDDPRRSGPVADVDRKEGSRRHVRNWGGPDFEKVKTGLDREKETHVRRPSGKNQVDMTMSMTGRERAEYMRWKKEREQIDQERLERHRNQKGQWRREWDAEKNESMFKDDATPRVEEEPMSRREKGKRGPPKPHTMGEYLSDGLSVHSQKRERTPRKVRSKPYNQHDSRWEEPEEPEERALIVEKEEKETCVEKEENRKEQKVEEPLKLSVPEEKPAAAEKEGDDEEEEEDDEEWTDASGDEAEDGGSLEDGSAGEENPPKTSPASPQPAPKEQRPPQRETPKLSMPPPSDSPQDSKPTTPFSPEAHQSVMDWGEEMDQLSSLGSSNEDSPPQAAKTREIDLSDSGSATPVQEELQKIPTDLTRVLESQESKVTHGNSDLVEVETPAGGVEKASVEEVSVVPCAGGSERPADDGGEIQDKPSDDEEPEPALESLEPPSEMPVPVVEGPAPAMAAPIATVEVLKPAKTCVYIADYQTVCFRKDSL